MTSGPINKASRLAFALGLLLGGMGMTSCFADDSHEPDSFETKKPEEMPDGPMPYGCKKAREFLKEAPSLEKKAPILWALRQSFKNQLNKGSAHIASLEAHPLETCLKVTELDAETQKHIHGLLQAEEDADTDEGIKTLTTLIHSTPDTPEGVTKKLAAPHVLNLRLAHPQTALWIEKILKMHEGAISPFRALQLLTKHRSLVADGAGTFSALAEALAREKLSLSVAGRSQVRALIEALKPTDKHDLTLLGYMKFLYGGDAAGVPDREQDALRKADARAGELAEQWNQNLSTVIATDGSIKHDAKLKVSAFSGPDREVNAEAWLKEQEATYGRDALLQWAIARGGEQGGRAIIAALKGKDLTATELVVRLPSSSPTLTVGKTEIHSNDRIQFSNLNAPEKLAEEASKLLPITKEADWDKLRFESPTKDAPAGGTIRLTGETPVRTPAAVPPPPALAAILEFEKLVEETQWKKDVKVLSFEVPDLSANTRIEGKGAFIGKPTNTEAYEPKRPLLLPEVLTAMGKEHVVPLGPEKGSPAIVGFDSNKQILVVREVSEGQTWFYAVPFDHYQSLTDPKAPASLGRQFIKKRTQVADGPWQKITEPKADKAVIESTGTDPKKQVLLLTATKRITARSESLNRLKEMIGKEKTQVQWGPGSGYFFGFNDKLQVLYLTFDGFDSESERTVFTIPYKDYTEIVSPKKD